MRKIKLIALTFALVLALAVPAMADQVNVYQNNQLVKSVVFKIDVPYYVINGQTPGVKMDVAPFIQDNRTFVPVRFLGNALGVDDNNIKWENDVQRVTMRGPVQAIEMAVGTPAIITMPTEKLVKNTLGIADRKTQLLDVAPVLKSNRTFLPARYVAEGLGYQVGWDDATQTVVCWPAGQLKPDVSGAVAYLTQFVDQQPQQPVQPPVVQGETFTTRAGYQIPKETKLAIPKDINECGPGDPNSCDLLFGIDLTKGDLESQWKDAAAILSQKIDSQTVDEVMVYVKQKTDRWDGLAFKTWESNGKKVGVSSMGGALGVQITVWYK